MDPQNLQANLDKLAGMDDNQMQNMINMMKMNP